MKQLDHLNRRTHLYLGLFVMPWLMMYGLSSFMLNHQGWFPSNPSARWQPLFEREYQRPVPDQADLREVAQEILRDCKLEGAFWAQRPKPQEIRISRFTFRDETRLSYSVKDHQLRAERQQFTWDRVLQRMHTRGGFVQHGLLDSLWAALVDVASMGILIWVGSGMLMWWRLTRLRFWGGIALGAGVLSFLVFIWRL